MALAEEIGLMVRTRIAEVWAESGSGQLPDYRNDENLFDAGVIDSLGMVEIVDLIETYLESTVDFVVTDPERFFTIDGIVEYVLEHSHMPA